MKMFSDCSGPCETCQSHHLGGCLAGHGDDDYVEATPEWLEANEDRIIKAQESRAVFYAKLNEQRKQRLAR